MSNLVQNLKEHQYPLCKENFDDTLFDLRTTVEKHVSDKNTYNRIMMEIDGLESYFRTLCALYEKKD